MNDFTQDLVEMIVRQSVVYLILFAGLIFAIARCDRHRSASAWAIIGFGWLIVFGLLADAWRDLHVYEWVIPDEATSWLIDSLSCALFSGLHAVGYVFLLAAAYAGRPWREHLDMARVDDPDEPVHR